MDLKQLEYIVKIAEENNITRAAEKLFLTQSALNQQLLKLERELGTPLFYRSRTDWRPTPAGELYLAAARRILLIRQDTYNKIYDIAAIPKGRISIGFTPGRGINMFSHVYPAFHAQFPDIQISPNELSVQNQHPLLLSGDLDIGFMTLLKSQRKAGLTYERLLTEELILAVPSGKASVRPSAITHPDAPFPVCELSYFKDSPFVLTNRASTIRELTDTIFDSVGFQPNVLFESANNNTIIAMIRAGICCGIVPMYYVVPNDPAITYYCLHQRPSWEVTAAFRKDYYISNAARTLINLAADYFSHPR